MKTIETSLKERKKKKSWLYKACLCWEHGQEAAAEWRRQWMEGLVSSSETVAPWAPGRGEHAPARERRAVRAINQVRDANPWVTVRSCSKGCIFSL